MASSGPCLVGVCLPLRALDEQHACCSRRCHRRQLQPLPPRPRRTSSSTAPTATSPTAPTPSVSPSPPLHATCYGYPPPPYYFPPGVYPPPYLPPPPQEERRRWRGRSWLDSFKHGAANEGGRNSVDLAFYYGQSYYMDHRQNNDQYHNSNLQQASDDDFDIE